MNGEDKVLQLLTKALHDEEPATRARGILSRTPYRRGLPWKIAGLIAACLVVLVPLASFQIPVVARAFSQVPLVGDIYARYIQESGMDVAYQAGLVGELNRSVTQNGITMTVLSAYSDASQGIIFVSFTSEDPARIEELWSQGLFGQEILRWGRVAFGLERSSSFEYVSEDNLIFGMIRMRPLSGLLGMKIGLRMTSRALSTVWEIHFPLQTVASSFNQTIKLNESFTHEGDKFLIQAITFSPSMTVVTYKQELSNVDIKPTPDGKGNGPSHISTRWSLVEEDGTPLHPIGSRRSGDGQNYQGELYFTPAKSDNLSLYFTGTSDLFSYTGSTTLDAGSKIETPQGSLVIYDVEHNNLTTLVSLQWQAVSDLKKLDAQIVDSNGAKARIVGWDESSTGVTLLFQHEPLTGPLKLHVSDFYVHYDIKEKVCDIQK